MVTRRLALVQGGPQRLEIRLPSLRKRTWDVLLDGAVLGELAYDDAIRGRTFTLDDGSTITVRFEPVKRLFGTSHRLRVERDGLLLRDSPGHPARAVLQGAVMLRLVGALIAVVGLVTLSPGWSGIDADPLTSIGQVIEGGLYLSLGFVAAREKRWALIAGLVLFLVDTAYGLAMHGVGGVGAWVIRAIVIMALARAIAAHRELGRVDALRAADVFR